jgi:hypothetical protein
MSTSTHVSGEMFLSAEAPSASFLCADKLWGIVVFAEQLRLGAWSSGGSAWLRCWGLRNSACVRTAAGDGRHEVGRNGMSIHHE